MIKSFDIKIPLLPMGEENTEEINKKLCELGVSDFNIVSIAVVEVCEDFIRSFPHKVQRVYYRDI